MNLSYVVGYKTRGFTGFEQNRFIDAGVLIGNKAIKGGTLQSLHL